jgi:hypothetical protein
MPAEVAALVIAIAFVFAGTGVLAATGMLPRGAIASVLSLGLAYVAGMAATMIVTIALICVGIAIHVVTFALISFLIGGAGILASLRHGADSWREWRTSLMPREAPRRPRWVPERWLVMVAGIILAAVVVLGYRAARVAPLVQWDGWSIWARKATILLDYGTPPAGFFAARPYTFMHPDYPLLVPLLESVWFRLVGAADTQSLHIEFWVLFVASLAAAGAIAMRFTRALIWVPLIGLIAVSPGVTGQLMTMYADVPMGLMLMLGVLLVGLWISEPRTSLLALGTLFLAAAASTKNEGLTAALCTIVVALAITTIAPRAGRRWVDLRMLLIASAGFVVAIAPWRIWLAGHRIGGDMPVGKGLDPSFLATRTGRIPPSLSGLYAQVVDQRAWLYILPLAIGAVLACLILRTARRPAAFYGLTGLAVFTVLVWGYVINPNAIGWLVATSANRTVDGVMFVAIAGLVQLTGTLLPMAADPRRRAVRTEQTPELTSAAAGFE